MEREPRQTAQQQFEALRVALNEAKMAMVAPLARWLTPTRYLMVMVPTALFVAGLGVYATSKDPVSGIAFGALFLWLGRGAWKR